MKKKRSLNRRSFLKTSGLAGVGLSVLSSGASQNITGRVYRGPKNQFQILITADIHSQLFTHDEFFWENEKPVFRKRGGLDVLRSMISHYRKKEKNTILIDAGDYFHGHAIATLTEGEALIPIMNEFNYDLILPGNWEVVYRKQKMIHDLGSSSAAKICANMWHSDESGKKGDLIFPPYYIHETAGARIGFIGYTDHLVPRRQPPAFSKGIAYAHATESVAHYIKLLREQEKCGIIFIVTHIGLAQQVGLANHPAAEGADFIIGSDTHERVREPIYGKYAKVIECGAFGSFLGRLTIETQDGKIQQTQYELLDVDPEKFRPDEKVTSMIQSAANLFQNDLKPVLGYTKTPLMRYFVLETPMDNFITDAIYWKFKPDIALSNGFRFCQPLAVSENGMAPITKEFLWNMLPLDSEAREGWVSGKQILDWLEQELENAFATDPSKRFGGWFVRFAGMKTEFTIGNPTGKRVQKTEIGGQALQPEKLYRIVACDREGDPATTLCRINNVQNPASLGVYLHKTIEEYLRAHSPISPVLEGRAIATDQPPTLLTQLQGTTYRFR